MKPTLSQKFGRITLLPIVMILILTCITSSCNNKENNISNLQCEMLTNPLAIDNENIRLSWQLSDDKRDVQQSGYTILVASSLEKLKANEGDLWNSKFVSSDKSIYIPYEGKKIESRAKCYWKVEVTTNDGKVQWSHPATWTVGLNPSDWQAKWTGLDKSFEGDVLTERTHLAARYFRKEFETKKKNQTSPFIHLGTRVL